MNYQADPKQTFAIVVGIEQYNAGTSWNLDGPVRDASRFVSYLLNCGVPNNQIRLFASPIQSNESELQRLDIASQLATYDVLNRAVIDELTMQSGDLLCLFWSGHGVIDVRNNQRLFCADATEQNPRHLSLNNLLATWRTDTIGRFSRQIGFIDACANYLESQRTVAAIPENLLPTGKPTSIEQFFIMAAAPGEMAANKNQSGVFSKALLEALGATWPPAMESINDRLAQQFLTLREQGKARQTPTYYWSQDWKGNTKRFGDFDRRSVGADSAESIGVDLRHELVTALLRCESMANAQARESILADLPADIKHNIARSSATRFDVNAIVHTASRYRRGLAVLLQNVHFFEGRSMGWEEVEKVVMKLPLSISEALNRD